MQTYNIIITEQQRRILQEALDKNIPTGTINNLNGDDHPWYDSDLKEANNLTAMISELPVEEAECPRCIHGFAL